MSFQSRYSRLDRALHRVAFASQTAQLGIADLEERVFRAELDAVVPGEPVLITGLPRAGTTILLELLAGCADFAAHTYRDMPFVLCPMIWQRMAERFQRVDAPRERAHGDGIEISLDSPEAFEEMLWQAFWRSHYGVRSITPWTTTRHPEFVPFFAAHRRKIIALRKRRKPTARRYVSKNNLNVARIPAIFEAVPDATVVVPFREPLQHAASLLRQHRRFLEMHRTDAFARRYMAAIGHFDFGANLRPVDFGGWLGDRPIADAERLGFWLEYWLATYRALLASAAHPRVVFVGFDRLGRERNLLPLADRLGLQDPAAFQGRSSALRAAPAHPVDLDGIAAELQRKVAATFAELERQAQA